MKPTFSADDKSKLVGRPQVDGLPDLSQQVSYGSIHEFRPSNHSTLPRPTAEEWLRWYLASISDTTHSSSEAGPQQRRPSTGRSDRGRGTGKSVRFADDLPSRPRRAERFLIHRPPSPPLPPSSASHTTPSGAGPSSSSSQRRDSGISSVSYEDAPEEATTDSGYDSVANTDGTGRSLYSVQGDSEETTREDAGEASSREPLPAVNRRRKGVLRRFLRCFCCWE